MPSPAVRDSLESYLAEHGIQAITHYEPLHLSPMGRKYGYEESDLPVTEYVAANPDGPYFSFGGAFEGTVEIYRDDIDAIIADKPFLMIAADLSVTILASVKSVPAR